MNHKEITALIKKISGQANFIGTPRLYVDIFDGDLVAAVWLNQVVYWDGKNKEPIGFYKTYAEWREELGLSEYQVRRVSKECERLGLVNITFRKVYGTPKNHYLVIWPELLNVINRTLEKPDPEETKGSETQGSEGEETQGSKEGAETEGSLTETEITTENKLREKNKCIEILQTLGHSVFGNNVTSWWNFRRRLEKDEIVITGNDKQMTIKGLSDQIGQFTEAEVFQDKYAPSFAKFGLLISFQE